MRHIALYFSNFKLNKLFFKITFWMSIVLERFKNLSLVIQEMDILPILIILFCLSALTFIFRIILSLLKLDSDKILFNRVSKIVHKIQYAFFLLIITHEILNHNYISIIVILLFFISSRLDQFYRRYDQWIDKIIHNNKDRLSKT
jgi:hypothetical protein